MVSGSANVADDFRDDDEIATAAKIKSKPGKTISKELRKNNGKKRNFSEVEDATPNELWLKVFPVSKLFDIFRNLSVEKERSDNIRIAEQIYSNEALWSKVPNLDNQTYEIGQRFFPDQWIDGDGIDEVLQHLLQIGEHNEVCLISSWFIANYHLNISFLPVNRATAKIFIYPCNLQGNHWIGMMYHRDRQTFVIYDSMDSQSSYDKYLKHIILFAWALQTMLKVSVPWDISELVNPINDQLSVPSHNLEFLKYDYF